MAALEFGNVPGQVLDAHLVIDTYISPLEHSPMGLHTVGVRHAVDVLFGRMLDGLVWAIQSIVGPSFVGVDLSRGFRPGLHLKRLVGLDLVGLLNRFLTDGQRLQTGDVGGGLVGRGVAPEDGPVNLGRSRPFTFREGSGVPAATLVSIIFLTPRPTPCYGAPSLGGVHRVHEQVVGGKPCTQTLNRVHDGCTVFVAIPHHHRLPILRVPRR